MFSLYSFVLFVLFSITVANTLNKTPFFPEQVVIGGGDETYKQERNNLVLEFKKALNDTDGDNGDNGDDGGDDTPLWKSTWLWIIVGVILLIIVILVGLLVVKQCLCEKKRKMKYNKLDIENTYGSHTPITDQHRADMEAKYGKLSNDY